MTTASGHLTSRQWDRLSKWVQARDGWQCQIQMEDICLGRSSCADHKVPRVRGGLDIPENLQAACRPCNLAKGGSFFSGQRSTEMPSS
jgi:5-methylcytosine-specific restriction endonuclease McrA